MTRAAGAALRSMSPPSAITTWGVHAGGPAHCPRCAYRSNARAPLRHHVAVSRFHTVIELATDADHGPCESESEVAACLVFAGLRPDQVEARANAPLLAICAR